MTSGSRGVAAILDGGLRARNSQHPSEREDATVIPGNPTPPEQLAEMLEDAQALDRQAEAEQAALAATAKEARAEGAGTDEEPSLIERIVDLFDGDDEPEAEPAEG